MSPVNECVRLFINYIIKALQHLYTFTKMFPNRKKNLKSCCQKPADDNRTNLAASVFVLEENITTAVNTCNRFKVAQVF